MWHIVNCDAKRFREQLLLRVSGRASFNSFDSLDSRDFPNLHSDLAHNIVSWTLFTHHLARFNSENKKKTNAFAT